MTRRGWVSGPSVVLLLVLVLLSVPVLQPVLVGSGPVGRSTVNDRPPVPALEPAGADSIAVDLAAPAADVSTDWGDRTAQAGTPVLGEEFASLTPDLGTGDWGVPLAALMLGAVHRTDRKALSNDNRRRVFEQVRATPGAHIAAIADAADIPRSTVRYHLRVLEEADLIAGESIGGKHHYAPVTFDLQTAAAVHDPPTRSLVAAVARFGPVSVTGLAEEVGRAPSTVSHHVKRLVDVGLLERERQGDRVILSLHPEYRERVEGTSSGPSTEPPLGLSAE